MKTAAYMREYRAKNGRDLRSERISRHLAHWRGRPHPRPCRTCSHPCPGPRCMTMIHSPYQVLCGFCGKRT
jgi:hypothetical protein